jgi:spectinomycin phosphotransferase
MLEPPGLSDDAIVKCLRDAYGISVCAVAFLPLGADQDSAVYRVAATDGTVYFLKLRRGALFEPSIVIPHWLHAQGVCEVIPPLPMTDSALWTRLEPFTVVLYPFVEGKDATEMPLSERQLVQFGAALRRLHDAAPSTEFLRGIPVEDYTPYWRDRARMFLDLTADRTFADPVAAQTGWLLQTHREALTQCIARTRQLAEVLDRDPTCFCLCHSDIHAWNILNTGEGEFYIVDWDTLVLAPRERDLMFIGAWAGQWETPREAGAFYAGYGPAKVDRTALAYYRHERVIQDVVAYCEALLLTEEGGADREVMYRQLASNFGPGGVLEYARATERM